jgi:hypothetical protein
MNDNIKEIEEKDNIKITKEKYPYMIKIAKDFGYKGNINDQDAIMKFVWNLMSESDKKNMKLELDAKKLKEEAKQKNLEIEKLKLELKEILPVYHKQITTASQEKGKLYTTKGKKDNRPDKEVNPARAVKGKIAIDTDMFYPAKRKGKTEKAIYQANRNLDANTSKLWDYATTKLAKQTTYKGRNIEEHFKTTINIKEYFSLIGEESTQENINKFIKNINNNYANALRSIIIIEPKCKLSGDVHIFSNVLYDKKKNHEEIYVYFFPPYAKFLTSQGHGKIKHIPDALYKIIDDDTYHIGSKLLDNYGQAVNRKEGGNYNKLSINVLIQCCSVLTQKIETMETLKEKRHSYRNIIEPFQNKLKSLKNNGIIEWWEYSQKGKIPNLLNEEQQAQLDCKNITDFELFKKLYITYKLKGFPLDNNAQIES